MADQVEIFGVKELDDFFQSMKIADQRRLFIAAWRIASKPLIQQSRANIRSRMKTRSTTRNLEKSVGFVPGRSRGKSVFISAKVGVRKGGNYKGYHGHLFDAGTTARTTSQGLNRGTMPATNWFSDSLSATESQLINDTQNHMLAALEKLIARKLKQQTKN